MKRFLILIAFVGVLFSGCSAPRIDARTDAAFEESLDRVRTSLPENRRPIFDASLSAISASLASGIDFTGSDVGVANLQVAFKRALNGKTGEEIIAYADDLKRGGQHMPAAKSEDQKTTDIDQRPPLVVGDNPDMSGNSFARSVSAQFGEPELRRLHSQLNSPEVKAKLQSYVCQDPLPAFTVTVVLWYEGLDQERQVRMQMTPPLYHDSGQLEAGIGYLFEQGVKALDKGPPIDYGYRKPLDGTPVTPASIDIYSEPQKPDCGSSNVSRH